MAVGKPTGARGARWAALLLLFALPLFLRLVPVRHGMPRNYLPDTHVVRSALGMAKDRNPVPEVGVYSTYPNLLPYALLPVYATQYAVGRARGQWGGAEEFKLEVALHPETVHLPARLLVALLAALTPWVVFRGARAAGLGKGAWVAAWLVVTGLLHTQFSVQERPWAPLVFFMALSVWPAALYVRDGRPRHLYASGLAAALAFACHQAGLPMLGIAGLAWLFGPPGWRGPELGRRLGQGVLCVALFAGVALLVGHPYLLVHGPTQAGAVSGGEFEGIKFGGQGFIPGFRWASFTRLSWALLGYDPVALLLGLVGLAAAVRRASLRPAAVFLLLWAAVFLFNPNDHVRYLLPVVVLLAYPAGLAAERLLERRGGLLLVAPLLAFCLVQDLRLGWVLSRPDSRALAEARLAELPPDARVVIDRYGPLPELDRASLERLRSWRPLRTREDVRLMALEAGPEALAARGLSGGVDAVPVEELLTADERAHTWALRPHVEELGPGLGELFRGLGLTHALLVLRGGERYNPLLEWLEARPGGLGEPTFAVSPAADGARPGGPDGGGLELMLPMELDFALTALWRVERPGPWIGLFPLGR